MTAMNESATSHLLPVFPRADLGFERGEGAWLIATNGERYLDFTSGVAVNALGHCHPHLIAALQEQASKLWHMSNLFKSPDGERLAARLCEKSFADFVFFANSGAEAMECPHCAMRVCRWVARNSRWARWSFQFRRCPGLSCSTARYSQPKRHFPDGRDRAGSVCRPDQKWQIHRAEHPQARG